MPSQDQSPKNRKFDLEERTARLGVSVIKFVKALPKDIVNETLIRQVVRSATSIGANYMEADAADSKKDFCYKIGLCKKESKETMHWLRMIANTNLDKKAECRALWKESHELCLIFSKIIISAKKKK